MNYKTKIAKPVEVEINSWPLSRSARLELLNFLYMDLAADPAKYLAEQIVPFLDRFTCPFTLSPASAHIKSRTIIFFVRRVDEQKELHVIAARFPLQPEENNGGG